MMRSLGMIAGAICRLNWWIGQTFSWLSLGIVLVCFTVVVLRYVFATSFLWLQDLYIWLNGAMFMAVAGFALLRDDHVRVDIFYRPARMRIRALVDLLGVAAVPAALLLDRLRLFPALRAALLVLSRGIGQCRRHAGALRPQDPSSSPLRSCWRCRASPCCAAPSWSSRGGATSCRR